MSAICTDIKSEEVQNSVGTILKEARRKNKVKDLSAIANDLCIKPYLLEAIEQDDFARFPSACYAVGFLRNYSDYLGLDTKSVVAKYEKEHHSATGCVVLEFPEAKTHNELPVKRIIGISALCIIICVAVWGSLDRFNSSDAIDKVAPTTISSVEKTVEQPATYAAAETQGISISDDVRLQALEDVWVRISESDGTVIVDKILEKGQDLVPPQSKGLNLMTNNAAAISVSVGVKQVKSLGGPGEIIESLSLEQEKLLKLSLLN